VRNFSTTPRCSRAEYLIDGEDEYDEHQIAFNLDRAAHTHEPAAEFILQSSVVEIEERKGIAMGGVREAYLDRLAMNGVV